MQLDYFGTDGIRGDLKSAILQPGFFRKLGWALGAFFKKEGFGATQTCLLGCDTRASGPSLGEALSDGLGAQGYSVQCLGVAPSAAVALTTQLGGFDAGLMITASHNPASDNGLKVFGPQGHKLSPEQELQIEAFLKTAPQGPYPKASLEPYPEGLSLYLTALQKIAPELNLQNLPFVVDCAHGAASALAQKVFGHYGWQGTLLAHTPDGHNINDGVGSEHPQALCEAVRAQRAPFGLAFDGDADRLLVCDPSGQIIAGEALLAILASTLAPQTLCVTTEYSNYGLDAFLQKNGLQRLRVEVGDRHVAHAMQLHGAPLGGEPSGHILWAAHSWCADALASALLLLKVLQKTPTPLAALAAQVPLLPRAEATLEVGSKKPFSPAIQKQLASIHQSLAPLGRLFVRYSGTQAKLRFLAEARSLAAAQEAIDQAVTVFLEAGIHEF